MNAIDIYPGSDYAVSPNGKPKMASFVHGCWRIRIVRVYKEQESHRKNATTFVEAIRLTREGERYTNQFTTTLEKFRAYDVVESWEDYEDQLQEYEVRQEQSRLEEEQRRLKRVAEREAVEKHRLEEQRRRMYAENERLTRLAAEAAEIRERMRRRGFNLDAITVVSGSVTVTKQEMQRWLGITVSPVGN